MLKKVSLFSLLLCLCACFPDKAREQVIGSQQATFRLVQVVNGLHHPWSLAFLPNGDFLVTERRGRLIRISADSAKKTEIGGVPTVYAQGQGGLLDVVLEPDFKDGGWVYLSYSGSAQDDIDVVSTEVLRARLDLRNNRLRHSEVMFVASPKTQGGRHFGGRILVTSKRELYLTVGERGDYMEQAQNPHNHLGSVIRLDVEEGIADDNPFVVHETNMSEIFTYGHRNPQGIALHPKSGEVWVHEHGPQGGDEINILVSGGNYGWPKATFGIDYTGEIISDKTSIEGMEDPVLHWTPSIAPSGMAFYTGDKFPEWEGDLFVGALVLRHLRRLELDGSQIIAQEKMLESNKERIRDVRVSPDGYLYILTDDTNGRLLRLEPVQQ